MPGIKINKCKSIRGRLQQAIAKKVNLDNGWISDHVATCTRCQKRLGNIARLNIAMNLVKTQPHNIDLLKNANTQAISVLKHSLREEPKAEVLRDARPGLTIFEKFRRCASPVLNAAACLMVIALFKTGIFTSMENSQKYGETISRNYYAMQAGDDIADDVFS